jgi:hypothetical protein
MLGMMAWREGKSPEAFFDEAVNDIIMYRDDLAGRGMTFLSSPLNTAAIIASLIDRQMEFSPVCVLDEVGDLYLDGVIAKWLQGKTVQPSEVEAGLGRLAKQKRQALAVRTYSTYFALMNLSADSSDVEENIRFAEQNYLARRRDPFYSGGTSIEGGGQDNDIAVDYRLAAIIHKSALPNDSIFRWQ